MTSKGSFKLQPSSHKQDNYLSRRFVGTVLGVTMLLTATNVHRALQSFDQQQLISQPSEIFNSQQYLPIKAGKKADFSESLAQIDRLAKELNYSGSSVRELATLLEQKTSTEAEKARIIYAWIAQHITYDVAAFNDAISNNNYPDVNVTKVLRDRTTICSGYSNLYQALAEAMNLESAIVTGYAKGATPPEDPRFQNVNHAWNSVRIDDAWYLLDATFGAGSIRDGKFAAKYNPYYFATPPQEFINKHYPEDPGWQLLAEKYTRSSFDNLPSISTHFYNLGLKTVSHHNYYITATNRIDIQLKAPENVVAIAELQQNNLNLNDNTVLVNRQPENIVVSVAPPNVGIYDLTIYAKRKDNLGHYSEVISYQIAANNSTSKFPKVYGHFYQHQARLIEPLSADLAPDWSTYFNLIVPQALDVQVINVDTNRWTPLHSYGDYFSGSVEIESGKTAVVAKFPGDEQYWQLIEYEAK